MEISDNEWMNKTVLIGNKDNYEKIKNENYNFNSPQSIQNNINIIYINQNKEAQSNLDKCSLYNFKSPEQNQKLFGKNKEDKEINDFQDKENQIYKGDEINKSNCFSLYNDGKLLKPQIYYDIHERELSNNNRTNSSDSNGSKSNSEKIEIHQIKFEKNNITIEDRKTKPFNQEIKILKSEEEKEEEKKTLKKLISELQNDKNCLEKLYNSKLQEFEKLKKSYDDKDKQNERLEKEINDKISYIYHMEETYKKKISELEKENSKLKQEIKLFENSIHENEIVHLNTKCNQCLVEPIKGLGYKCKVCDNYNLCRLCFEKNRETRTHKHFLYKIQNNNNKNNNIVEINNNNIKEYSYKCLTSELRKIIYRGKTELKMQITIQNNCKDKWPENTKLILDINNSQILTEDIVLNPLAPNEQMTLNITFKDLQNLPSNKYKVYFDFNVNGTNFGDKLCIIIIIKQESEEEILTKFRKKYNTPIYYKDETILSILEETDGEFEKTFFRLYFT